MAKDLADRILDLIETKLAAITVAGGYQVTVAGVHRPPLAHHDIPATPAISVRRLPPKASRWHIRGAEEFQLQVQLILVADTDEVLSQLMSDVRKVIAANLRWNDGSEDLAVRTWFDDDNQHEEEVVDLTPRTGRIAITIMARASVTDPSQVKVI